MNNLRGVWPWRIIAATVLCSGGVLCAHLWPACGQFFWGIVLATALLFGSGVWPDRPISDQERFRSVVLFFFFSALQLYLYWEFIAVPDLTIVLGVQKKWVAVSSALVALLTFSSVAVPAYLTAVLAGRWRKQTVARLAVWIAFPVLGSIVFIPAGVAVLSLLILSGGNLYYYFCENYEYVFYVAGILYGCVAVVWVLVYTRIKVRYFAAAAAAFSLLIWCAALAYAYIERSSLLGELKKAGISYGWHYDDAAKDGTEFLEQLKMQKNRIFELSGERQPVRGLSLWTAKGANIPQKEEIKELFDSPAAQDYFRTAEKISDYRQFRYDKTGKEIYPARSFDLQDIVRVYCARAALAHYYGDKAGILPPLAAALKFRHVANYDKYLIISLARYTLSSMIVQYAVSLGPDDAAYTPAYRELLNSVRDENYKYDDAAFYGWLLEDSAALQNVFIRGKLPKSGLVQLLMRPVFLIETSGFLKSELAGRKEVERMLASGRYVTGEEESNPVRSFLRIYNGRNAMMLALALKIYRVEHGAYPATLSALVPAILPALPRKIGYNYEYTSSGSYFIIKFHQVPCSSTVVAIDSRPNY